MKANTHPTWHADAKVTCACGNSFTTGATVAELTVDICSKCHPFFTGEMRFVDRQGRVDKFRQKMKKAQQNQSGSKKKTQKQSQEDSKSYRQILQDQKKELKQSKAA